MMAGWRRLSLAILMTWLMLLAGCLLHTKPLNTPTSAGLNTNNLIDPASQVDAHDAVRQLHAQTTKVQGTMVSHARKQSVLCLSGGGVYGAYTVGVLCGWTQTGTRPCFSVVTGISTGALIAPYAFLGSSYDGVIKELYTTMNERDIYRLKPISGAFSESFASNRPLARKIHETVTPEMIGKIADEHRRGRRLYIGTTEMEGKRFIVWDLGAIACQGRPQDRELIEKILLASSAIPGLFPSVKIDVTVNGESFQEMHVDGSVTQSVFFRPPAEQPGMPAGDTQVYVIVAGKIYADPEPITPRSLTIAIENLATFSYAHTRGDLFRIWSTCQMTGRGYHQAALPQGFPIPKSMAHFDQDEMNAMFNEGVKQATQGTAWRNTAPGLEPGEDPLVRSSTELMVVPRTLKLE